MRKESGSKIFNIFIRPLIPRKFKKRIDQSVESLYEDLPRMRDMIIPILIVFILWILAATQVYIISLAFSINVPYLTFIFIIAISAVAASVPISVAGLGIREGTLALLLSIFRVNPEAAFVISLSGYLVRVLLPGLPGWILTLKKR